MSSSIERLKDHLDQPEIHLPGTAEYLAQSLPWSQHADAKPKLVITPSTLPSLQACVKLLYADESLDFAVRNTGTGSASARDVILSMRGFKSFSFDAASETVIVGAGLDWSEVELKMAADAPGYALVGARCGWVGAAGGALVGGYSWLSHEFGLISDPQNLLDAQVVLKDGRVVWASEEGDGSLLWALRGGGGNFGVVVGLKMRARTYHEAIFAGLVFLPYERLQEVGEWVERSVDRLKDPKTAFCITNQGPGTGVPPQGAKPGIAVILFDAHGEEHANSKDKGFGEVFEMEGLTKIACGMVPLSGMTKLAESYRSYQGVNQFWGSAPMMEEHVDAGLIKRAWDWYAKTIEECPVLDQGSTVLFEFCQAGFFNSSGSHTASGWPHSGRKHVMQVVLGCKATSVPPNLEELVHKRLSVAETEIGDGKETGEYHAGFLHDWSDLDKVFGGNLRRLRAVKETYDPANRFNKSVPLVARA
jgi:hypothetical protein